MIKALPLTLLMFTNPQKRLSALWSRLSPMTNSAPGGTVTGPKLSRLPSHLPPCQGFRVDIDPDAVMVGAVVYENLLVDNLDRVTGQS